MQKLKCRVNEMEIEREMEGDGELEAIESTDLNHKC